MEFENGHSYCHPCATVSILSTLGTIIREEGDEAANRSTDLKDSVHALTDLLDQGGYALGSALDNIDASLHNLQWYATPLPVRIWQRAGDLIRKRRTRRPRDVYIAQMGLYARKKGD
jgi:hypothetical protein